MISGIMLMGVTGMFQGPDDAVPVVTSDPVWLSAEAINRGIVDGSLKAGVFNNVDVNPPVEAWPENWRHLKE